MNSDLKQFLDRYLPVIFATVMSVGFFAFIAIPYTLGAHPGDDRITTAMLKEPTQAASAVAPD